jgi:hypothetical protein
LRNIIATKEYELQRQEKMIQKKGSMGAAQRLAAGSSAASSASASAASQSPSGGPGPSANSLSAGSAQELIHVLNSLKCDIRELKEAYQSLTGVSYESSSRRRFLSGIRGKGERRGDGAGGGKEGRRYDHEQRFEAAYAAAAAADPSTSPPLPKIDIAREKILEARAVASLAEYDNFYARDERPYPRMWKLSL